VNLVPAISARAKAAAIAGLAAPLSPEAHLFESGGGFHLLVADGSQVFDLDRETYARLREARATGALAAELAALGLSRTRPAIDDAPPVAPTVRAISLAIAQKCNLGCVYCYARQGDFGGAPKNMPIETARAAIDLLLRDAAPGERARVAFLGGEPLTNRAAMRQATQYAADEASRRGVAIAFSITTNGTLLAIEDAEFFEQHGFAVTVSLDGSRDAHNRLRPFRNGRGSYDVIVARAATLLARQRRMQVSARVTVTPANLGLRETLEELIALDFHSVGFSPTLHAPGGDGEMQPGDLEDMLADMITCGEECERRAANGERYPFANLLTAIREIHKGAHKPYPCGAGAGYIGVSADGDLAACHRFVGDAAGALGSLAAGLDAERRAEWLAERHVHRQSPCRECWARYLCGGGCHHEVIHGGRAACDYIRGWLHYCLGAYVRLSTVRPDMFEGEWLTAH
jgi:uncharacterized protein